LEAYALDTVGSRESHIVLELQNSRRKYLSPSATLLKALREKGYTVVEDSRVRYPKDSEMDPTDPQRYRGLELKESGTRVVYYYFGIVKELGGNRFIIEYYLYGGPLYGGGSEWEVEFVDGKIILQKKISGFIS
jgi:hypothetical protein